MRSGCSWNERIETGREARGLQVERACSRGLNAVYHHGLRAGADYAVEAGVHRRGDEWTVTYTWRPRAPAFESPGAAFDEARPDA
jgi:hypothetical protein